MAKIQTVDYEAIPSQAKQIREYGQQLNTQVTTAYNNIDNMHSSWYGKRYNELVKQFNSLTSKINDMLTLVVTDIPYALETVANNYSQADKGVNATSAQKTAPKKLSNITIHNDTGMKFITSNVAEVQNKVSNNFKNAKDQMNKIDQVYSKITWQSEAADAFKTKFTKQKKEVISAFENIESQFSKLMTQTQEDIQSAETANTVS